MGALAVLLLVLGFGTFVLNLFDREFSVLSWADDYQPWLSLGLGVLGVVIIVFQIFFGRDEEPAAASEPSKEA